MSGKYRPVLVPATLPHRPYVLPAVGTDDYPRDPHREPDDLDRFLRQSGLDRGTLYVETQEMRVEEWAQAVAAYEANPHDFGHAWRWLNTHPFFYKFRFPAPNAPTADVIQERNLDHESGVSRIWLAVGTSCELDGCEGGEECGHPEQLVVMMECGQYSWPGDFEPGRYEPRDGTYSYHDYELDVYGETYEECIMQLAYLVWHNYGNDRVIADAPRKED